MEDARYENKYCQKNRNMPRIPTGGMLTSWVFTNQGREVLVGGIDCIAGAWEKVGHIGACWR